MEDALAKMAASVRKFGGLATELRAAASAVASAPPPPKAPPRMSLAHLWALARSLGPLPGSMSRKPRYVRGEGETTPAVRQPRVRCDGVIESPVPRGIARALRSRG
jgi:hypothetical protein